MLISPENSRSTSDLLLKVFHHLDLRRRLQLGLIFIVMLISGIAELISLGAVLPFLAVISNPEDLLDSKIIQYFNYWDLTFQPNSLIVLVTILFSLSTLTAMIVRLVNLWVNNQLVAAIGSDLSVDAFRRTLYQSYETHIQSNSSSLITSMTAHISRSVTAFSYVLQMATSSVVVAFIFSGLLYINWKITLFSAFVVGAIYTILGYSVRSKLQKNSRSISFFTKKQIKSIQESIGSIRDITLDASQAVFINPYSHYDRTKRFKQATNNFLSGSPRFVIESLGIVLITTLAAFLALTNNNDKTILPLLGVVALGAQRLLPSLQQIYAGWCKLKTFTADLEGLCNLLDQKLPPIVNQLEPIKLQKSLDFINVSFSYISDSHKVLDDVSVKFKSGERIGIIGSTGSGKSTFVDLLMGLLKPTAGELCIDGINVYEGPENEFLLKWRASIAHVPQSIYLSDASIAENIAFGLNKDQIDFYKVISSAKSARIHDYIESTAEGYESYVGERGIRLSGGQRQRIGIARALYKTSAVLVLDEATSALDDATEQSVMESIADLGDELTIFMIAHRQSTLRCCDRIFKINSNQIFEVDKTSLY